MSNDPKPREVKPAGSASELNGMPEFAKAIKGLANVKKIDVAKEIARSNAEAPKKRR
jgi:hypothetical protein